MIVRTVIALSTLLLVSSCSVSCNAKQPGPKEMAENLQMNLEGRLEPNISKVVCPPNAKQKKNLKYDCKVHYKKGKIRSWEMEWIDNSLFTAWLVLQRKDVEDDLRKRINKPGMLKSVECKQRMLLKPTTSYLCTAIDTANTSYEFKLLINDKNQTKWELVKKPGAGKAATPKTPAPKTPAPKAPAPATPAKK